MEGERGEQGRRRTRQFPVWPPLHQRAVAGLGGGDEAPSLLSLRLAGCCGLRLGRGPRGECQPPPQQGGLGRGPVVGG